jgi:hypothetical protein
MMLIATLLGVIGGGMLFGDDMHELWEKDTQAAPEPPIQLQGYWMGMKLMSQDMTSVPNAAGVVGITPKGATVLDISERFGWRMKMAGIMPGDVITAVDGKKIASLTDFESVTRNLKNTGGPIPMELQRWGQPVKITVPPLAPLVPAQQPQFAQPVPQAAWGAQPIAMQGPHYGTMPMGFMDPMLQAAGPGQPGTLYCQRHNMTFTPQQVAPSYRCPLCAGPLAGAPAAWP